MSSCALITTYYCFGCNEPSKEYVKQKLKFDGELSDLYINFSNEYDPFNTQNISYVGVTKRKDLVYGKIFLLKKFIEKNILNKYSFLMHIDFSDTKFCKSFTEMVKKFESSKLDFIISTEKTAWPYIHVLNSWSDSELFEKEFSFLNSGAIISKVGYFYNILCELELLCLKSNIDFWDDQGVWQYYDLKKEKLLKDETCEYFFSTALLDESYYTIKDNEIITKFGSKPYLIHDNSSFSLNLIQKI